MTIKRILAIMVSLILAICLSILPLPDWANWLRPAWVALVLIYWILVSPQYVNIGIAWIIGLFLDVLNGTVLGEHALALTIVAFITAKLQRQLRLYPSWQQAIFVFISLFIYHLMLFIIQWISGQIIDDWRFWFAPLISMLLWPWIFLIMQKYQRKLSLA